MRKFLLLLCFAVAALGQKETEEKGLRDYDIRVASASVGAQSSALTANHAKNGAVNHARATFGSQADGLRLSLDRFGRVRLLANLSGSLAKVDAAEPALAAREFLNAHPTLFGNHTSPLELAGERRFGPMTQVRFRQLVGGIPVWGGETAVTLNTRGEVIQVQAGETVSSNKLTGQATLSAADAAAVAAKIARVVGFEQAVPATGPSSRSIYFENPAFPGDPIIVQTVAFPESLTSAYPAFRVFVTASGTASYAMLISAVDGTLLFRTNLVSKMAQARVWKKSPTAGDRELVDLPDDWLPPDGTATVGNNADAFLDLDSNTQRDVAVIAENIVDGRASSPARIFDFPAGEGSTGQDPGEFPAARVTSVFYTLNAAHDYFYALGFDEAAGNFQTENFGKGGLGGDPALGLTQITSDPASLTRPDGEPFLVSLGTLPGQRLTDPTDDTDFAYSAQAIVHEYAHGVTHRMIGGPNNVSCLFNQISRALGEGWSDYFATSMTNDPVMGAYMTGNSESGVRRRSYADHPLNSENVGEGGYNIYNDGEIWAATLWDLRTEFGKQAVDQLVFNGVALTPCNPTMSDARGALVLAANLMNAAATDGGSSENLFDIGALWRILAARGLGFSATGADGFPFTQMITVNAAFDTPPAEASNQNPRVDGRLSGLVEYLGQFSYQIQAQDPDGDPLTFKMLEGPEGMSVSESGLVRWTVTQFSVPRAKVEITDGKGGRILHIFTLPVNALLQPGAPVEISGAQNQRGRAVFVVPPDADVVQFRLRQGGGLGDADMVVFGPLGQFGLSVREESDETLGFVQPTPGEWEVLVDAFLDYQDVRLSAVVPEPEELQPDTTHGPFADVTSGQTYYRFLVPDGVESVTVSAGGGSGDADLFLAKGIVPVCQFSPAVLEPCTHTSSSLLAGNFERITIETAASAAIAEPPAKLAVEPGEYFLNVSADVAYEGLSLLVNFDTGPGFPNISDGGVVSAADFSLALSPGSIGSIFGAGFASDSEQAGEVPLPRNLAGARVLIEGVEAPLFFVSERQINFQVPFEVTPDSIVGVSVERNGVPGPLTAALVLSNAPSIFGYNRTAEVRDPIITHADGSLVTPDAPARPAEVLIVYATGLGQLDNAPRTGEPSPASPLATLQATPSVIVSGQEANVLFAGLTPGLVGLAQINIQLSSDLPTSLPVLPLALAIGNQLSADVPLYVAPGGGN